MKTSVKVGIAMLVFGVVMALVGVVFIRAHASKPQVTSTSVAVMVSNHFASHKA